MTVKETRVTRIHGALILIAVALALLSTDCTPKEPTPFFNFSMNLIEPPQPFALRINSLKRQQGLTHSDFNFNLAPFIEVSQPEFSYQIYNASWDIYHVTSKLMGTAQRISGLPNGVAQITTKAGDCPQAFTLSSAQSCLLRFRVDKNTYSPLPNSEGPVVFMHMSWYWGSKQNRHGGEIITVYPSQTIANVLAPIMSSTQLHVTPTEQDGLRYDPASTSITGKPTRTGLYYFTISATRENAPSEIKMLEININTNPYDKPVFKQNYRLASAMPEQHYHLNLMSLIESTPGFAVTNQVSFKIDIEEPHPSWLRLDKKNPTILHGQVPSADTGQIKEVTVIATSNTGGDSLPMTIQIPVAFDLENHPVIEHNIELTGETGTSFKKDFRTHITDSTTDGSLQLILEKIEPTASWLSISRNNPTEVNGSIPIDTAGQLYQLTLHANTAIGGNSDSITIPLQIAMDYKTH